MKGKIKIRYVFLGVVVIVSLCITSYIVACGFRSGLDYISELVVYEQNDHYIKMQKHISRLNYAVNDWQDVVDNIQKKKLTLDEKKLIRKSLRNLDEIGLNISRETGFYQEDTTVHFFFEPRNEIVTYFKRTRNTPLYIDRFVRAMEQGLFAKNITKEQQKIIVENYELLRTEIDNVNSR